MKDKYTFERIIMQWKRKLWQFKYPVGYYDEVDRAYQAGYREALKSCIYDLNNTLQEVKYEQSSY